MRKIESSTLAAYQQSILILSSMLNGWDVTELSGLALVFLGVAGEVVAERLSESTGYELRRRTTTKKWSEKMLIIGLAIDLAVFPHHIKEAARLNDLAGKANERASKLDSARVELEKQVEELRKANLELEAQMSPRMIEQFSAGGRLKIFAGTTATIISALGDDCTSAAAQIDGMLRIANWNTKGIVVTPKPVESGILVGICSTNEDIPILDREYNRQGKSETAKACAALVDDLNMRGVAAKVDEHMNWKTTLRFEGILVCVGKKPTKSEAQLLKEEDEIRKMDRRLDELSLFSTPPDLLTTTNRAEYETRLAAFLTSRPLIEQLQSNYLAAIHRLMELGRKGFPIATNTGPQLFRVISDKLP